MLHCLQALLHASASVRTALAAPSSDQTANMAASTPPPLPSTLMLLLHPCSDPFKPNNTCSEVRMFKLSNHYYKEACSPTITIKTTRPPLDFPDTPVVDMNDPEFNSLRAEETCKVRHQVHAWHSGAYSRGAHLHTFIHLVGLHANWCTVAGHMQQQWAVLPTTELPASPLLPSFRAAWDRTPSDTSPATVLTLTFSCLILPYIPIVF